MVDVKAVYFVCYLKFFFSFLEDYLSAMVSLLPVYHEYIRNHSSALQVSQNCSFVPSKYIVDRQIDLCVQKERPLFSQNEHTKTYQNKTTYFEAMVLF